MHAYVQLNSYYTYGMDAVGYSHIQRQQAETPCKDAAPKLAAVSPTGKH